MARKTPIRHDPVVSIFAEKLRLLRRSRGMTQRDLARLAHITESYLSRLESGLIAPGIDLATRIAAALGSPLAELLSSGPDLDPAQVLKEQAQRLLDRVIRSEDKSLLLLVNQMLALLAEAVERQR